MDKKIANSEKNKKENARKEKKKGERLKKESKTSQLVENDDIEEIKEYRSEDLAITSHSIEKRNSVNNSKKCFEKVIDITNIIASGQFISKEIAKFALKNNHVTQLKSYDEEFDIVSQEKIAKIQNGDYIDLLDGYNCNLRGGKSFSPRVQLNVMQKLLLDMAKDKDAIEKLKDKYFGSWRFHACRLAEWKPIFLSTEYEHTLEHDKRDYYSGVKFEYFLTESQSNLGPIDKRDENLKGQNLINAKFNLTYIAQIITLQDRTSDNDIKKADINIFFTSEIDAIHVNKNQAKETVELKTMFKSVFTSFDHENKTWNEEKAKAKLGSCWIPTMLPGVNTIYLGLKTGNIKEKDKPLELDILNNAPDEREKVVNWLNKFITPQLSDEDLFNLNQENIKQPPTYKGRSSHPMNSFNKYSTADQDVDWRKNSSFNKYSAADQDADWRKNSSNINSKPPSRANPKQSSTYSTANTRMDEYIPPNPLKNILVVDVPSIPKAIFENEEDKYIGIGFLHEILHTIKDIMDSNPSIKLSIEYDNEASKIYIREDDIFTNEFKETFLKTRDELNK